jgi:PAS domain S-box-containing protein
MLEKDTLDSKGKVNYEIIEISIFLLGLFLVFLTRIYSFLLFHSIAELFSIVIAGGVFLVGWNSRKYMKDSFFLNLGIASLFVAVLDLIHTLSYSGMQIFLGYDANLPTSLWIAARWVQSGAILLSSHLVRRSIKPRYLLSLYFITSILLFVLIFNGLFPLCYIDTVGLTPFKIISEYLINFILLISLLMILRRRIDFDKKVLILIVSSIVFTIFAELAFTFYVGVYDLSNVVGHLFKIIAFYLLYKSLIQIGIEQPFSLLFRRISRSELELRNIIKHSGAGITMLDENGKYLLVNEKAAIELGGVPEDFIGKTLHDVLPQEIADEYLNSNRELIKDGRSRAYQRTFDLPAGKATYWIIEQPIMDEKSSSLLSVATDITERKKAEDDIKKREYDLGERVKELTCLYNISKLIESAEITIQKFLENALSYIPPAWQYPEITCARILYKDQELTTDNFRETEWYLKTNIREYGNVIGAVEVYYLDEMPEMDEGPFFREERFLVDGISEMISTFLERKIAED